MCLVNHWFVFFYVFSSLSILYISHILFVSLLSIQSYLHCCLFSLSLFYPSFEFMWLVSIGLFPIYSLYFPYSLRLFTTYSFVSILFLILSISLLSIFCIYVLGWSRFCLLSVMYVLFILCVSFLYIDSCLFFYILWLSSLYLFFYSSLIFIVSLLSIHYYPHRSLFSLPLVYPLITTYPIPSPLSIYSSPNWPPIYITPPSLSLLSDSSFPLRFRIMFSMTSCFQLRSPTALTATG